MKKSPSMSVSERFESKEKLVKAVEGLASAELWLDRVNSEKGLARVSNAKLLRLHSLLTEAKAKFGSRDKLIGAILELERRGKDSGYRTRLEGYPLPRLMDLHSAANRRNVHAAAKTEKAAAKKAPAKKAAKKTAKKAPAKKAQPSA